MVDGFLVIDKPAGISSHGVVGRVRHLLGTKKVGHTGTLDPFATGVLPIAVGEGTKAIQFLDEGEKGYEAVLRLGLTTDTLDITGTVLQDVDATAISEQQLLTAMARLTGSIEQIPPMYSAIKQGGQPLYKLARKGVEVERAARPVTIHTFDLLEFAAPLARVRVRCSRGTYIRTLADDLGRLLGCGACLTELRRTASGPFRLADSLTLEQLAEAVQADLIGRFLVSPLAALSHLTQVAITTDEAARVRNGQTSLLATLLPQVPQSEQEERCSLTCDGALVAVLSRCRQQIVLQRVFN